MKPIEGDGTITAGTQDHEWVLGASPAVITRRSLTADLAGVWVSPNIRAQTGYAPSEFTEAPDFWAKRIHPEDRERVLKTFSRADANGAAQEYRWRTRDRSYRWLREEVRLVHDGANQAGLVGAWLDITDRKAEERRLLEDESRYRTLFDQAPGGAFVSDATGNMVDVNEVFARLHGYTVEEMLKLSLRDFDTPETAEHAPERLDRIIEGESMVFDVQHYHKDGHVFPLMVSASRIMIDGKPHILGMHMDITDRKAAEEEIRRLNSELEAHVRERTAQLSAANLSLSALNRQLLAANEDLMSANMRLDEATRAKSEFLAAMSHELRTPLNSILGFSGVMLQGLAGELGGEQRKQVMMISNSGKHLLELINHILDLSRIEAGKLQIFCTEFEAFEVVASVAEKVADLAAGKDVELRTDVDSACSSLRSDRTRVEQILLNLAGNAVKFTDGGTVVIRARKRRADHVFEIEDSGCGIPAGEIERIFDEFYQVPRPGVAKEPGTGLGLPVSRRLARALGGDIAVRSEVGTGSTFTLRVPTLALDDQE